MIKLIRQLFQTAFALTAMYAAGSWAMNHAYACRGYNAAGSEYIFILAVYWVSYKIAGIFIRLIKKKHVKCRSYQKKCDLCQDHQNNIIIWYDKRKFPLTEKQEQHKEDQKC